MAVQKRPLLFMKTAVVGAEPLGFYADVAELFDADVHSTDYIRMQINGGEFGDSSPELSARIAEETEARCLASLQAGTNTLYDGFLNTRLRRRAVRERVIEPAGALGVLLYVHAPMTVIIPRLKRRHENDQLTMPSSLVTVEDTLRATQRMSSSTERPTSNEPHLKLDGQEPANVLLAEVADYVMARLAAQEASA